jgi:pimeloyl-ACP methyl ester carboxylesterase
MKIAVTVVVILAVIVAAVFVVRSCGDDSEAPDATLTAQPDTEDLATADPPGSGAGGAPGAEGRLVDVGGHRLMIRSFGTGTPAVVIEPGIGDAGRVWGGVIDALSRETMVVLYDRAGYGDSDPGPMPRSADRVVKELSGLLTAAPVDPPYIMVGHSLGAMHALIYASEHPNQVDGLVLLDPPPLGFIKGERFPRLQEMAEQMTAGFRSDAESARAAGDERQALFLEAVASEHEAMFESGWRWMASVRSLGDTPLVVIASGVPNPEFGADAAEFQRFWSRSSDELSTLSTRGRFVFLHDSTHDIPGDAPGEVIDAVYWCIAESEMAAGYDAWQGEK